MATFTPPPRRVDDFRERYMRKRNPGVVTKVETPYGETLAERNPRGTPTDREGRQGTDILDLAMQQLGRDNSAYTSPTLNPDQGGYPVAQRGLVQEPFEAGTGKVNHTPYGTVSSRPPTEEERVQAEWNSQAATGNNGNVANAAQPLSAPSEAAQQAAEDRRAQQVRLQQAFQNENSPYRDDPAYKEWEAQENARRAANGLGDVNNRFGDFIFDKEQEAKTDDLAKQLVRQANQNGRMYRDAQRMPGRRGATSTGVRTSPLTRFGAEQLKDEAKALAAGIVSGRMTTDAVTDAWNKIQNRAAYGTPIQTPDQIAFNEQLQSNRQRNVDAGKRLQIAEDESGMRKQQVEQERKDRERAYEGWSKYMDATTESERNKVLKDYPELGISAAGLAITRAQQQEQTDRQDYTAYARRLQQLTVDPVTGMQKDTSKLTPQEQAEVQFLQNTISQFIGKQAQVPGVAQPSAQGAAAPANTPAPAGSHAKLIFGE